eukprot:TRINITY_DN1212_c0_g1_i1.p1 TRINITY_DN1212_c0_g1~~TRINITY_DN1212_c0_g1_i1.p1  ORF type:complete len:341 (-),score=95.12 TRINITY_DN1212_c0_g1_i1:90-1112(-)
MNSRGVAHRDLKPDNLLLAKDRTLKVSDFGLSKDFSQGSALRTSVGTACYVAPEVISGKKYTTLCDIWSCGVIAYITLSGQMPFHGPNNDVIFQKIKTADYSFPSPYFDHVSTEALDFIEKILVTNVKQRMEITSCLLHPWMRKWHSDLQKRYIDLTCPQHFPDKKKLKKSRQMVVPEERTKYTSKPVDATAAEPSRPEKNSIVVAEIDYGEDDFGFPPLVAHEDVETIVSSLSPLPLSPPSPPPSPPASTPPPPASTPRSQQQQEFQEKIPASRVVNLCIIPAGTEEGEPEKPEEGKKDKAGRRLSWTHTKKPRFKEKPKLEKDKEKLKKSSRTLLGFG